MILGPPDNLAATTLDNLFRRAVARRPDEIAVADPPNRQAFTDGPPRRLSYDEADRVVSAIAARLRKLSLPRDAVVGIQLPNTVESVLALLAVLRAGMIAAPLPFLWRRTEAVAALGLLDAKAIITTSRAGEFRPCALAMEVAAAVFPIRHVASFGTNLADGVISLDETLSGAPVPESSPEPGSHAAAHVAVVTFDVTPGGIVPVARNHAELIAGGLATLLEGGIAPDARLLGCCATGSFAGLALTVMPWLLSGGMLSLHHGFDANAFAAQSRVDRCDTLVVPGALVPQLTSAGLLAYPELKNIIAYWRAPERLAMSPAWRPSNASLTDMLAFGETALIGSRRDADGVTVPLPAGPVTAPRDRSGAVTIAETARTASGTVALRGSMVPRHAFPPGAEQLGAPHLKADAQGFVDTAFACRLDRMTGTLTVTGPPPGSVSVGGYRFVMAELEDTVRRTNSGAFVTALPDTLAGHRLAGISGEGARIHAALTEIGVNPLVADAFRAV